MTIMVKLSWLENKNEVRQQEDNSCRDFLKWNYASTDNQEKPYTQGQEIKKKLLPHEEVKDEEEIDVDDTPISALGMKVGQATMNRQFTQSSMVILNEGLLGLQSLVENAPFLTNFFSTSCHLQLCCNCDF